MRLVPIQRRRVTLWVQARTCVPSSTSLATSGAPQNRPSSAGATTLRLTTLMISPSPWNRVSLRVAQEAVAAQVASARW